MRSSDCGCRLNTAVQGGVAMWDAAALQGEAISQLSTMKCIVSQYLSNYCSTMQWPVCSPPAVGRVTETGDINQILQQPTHFTPSHAARPGTAALQHCSVMDTASVFIQNTARPLLSYDASEFRLILQRSNFQQCDD